MGCGASSSKYELDKGGAHLSLKSQPKTFEVLNAPASRGGEIDRHSLIMAKSGRIDKSYDMKGGLIGEGGFGSVRKGTCKATGAIRAIKSMAKSNTESVHFSTEIEIMRHLDHPNIVKLYETFEDGKFYYLVLELCTGGELCDAIVRSKRGFTEKVAAKLVKQMVGGVSYLHACSIAHRDLKPENFLLASDVPIEEAVLKMLDFGLSKQFTPGTAMTSKTGTIAYTAPEVLTGNYDEKCDVWSLGVITFLLLSGKMPFKIVDNAPCHRDTRGEVHLTFRGAKWDSISDDGKDFISKLIVLSPIDRLSAAAAYQHTWVEQLAPHASSHDLAEVLGNLKEFQVTNKLEKSALMVMALQLSDDALKEIRVLFESLDKDGSGQISVKELSACLLKEFESEQGEQSPALRDLSKSLSEKLGSEHKELSDLVEEIDTNGNKSIDYTEFIIRMMDKKAYAQRDACWAAFRVFDLDDDGVISTDELAMVISGGVSADMEKILGIEREEIERIVKETDLDGNGTIDFEEFMKMMQRQRKPSKPTLSGDHHSVQEVREKSKEVLT
jgi:calcium-dependent protein kinase